MRLAGAAEWRGAAGIGSSALLQLVGDEVDDGFGIGVGFELVPSAVSSAFSSRKFSMMPLWTTETLSFMCGCALRSVGRPCVAQRVWPMPVWPFSGCSASRDSRLRSLPSARRRSRWPFSTVAMPALS